MANINELKKMAADLHKFSINVSEIQWLDIGNRRGGFETYVKDADQWYLIEHEEGGVIGGREVDEEEVTQALADSEGRSIEHSNESFKTFDHPGFFTLGEDDKPIAIAEVLNAINHDFDAWLAGAYN